MKKQIIAIGGGGFSKENVYTDEDIAMSRFFLKQTGKKIPSICFLPTASADDARYTVNFYSEFQKLPCKPSHLSLFSPTTRDIASLLLEKDAIFVGGGSTKNLIALWREWGVDQIMKIAYEKGIVLGGISAGMNCWFEECVTDSLFGDLSPLKCLGILKGSACPHYHNDLKRRPAYHSMIKNGKMRSGVAVEDHAAIHYINGEVHQIFTTKNSGAYHVYKHNGKVVDQRL